MLKYSSILLFLTALFAIGRTQQASEDAASAPAFPLPGPFPIGEGQKSQLMDAAVASSPTNDTTNAAEPAPGLPPIPVPALDVIQAPGADNTNQTEESPTTAANEPAPGLPPIPVPASDVIQAPGADNTNQTEASPTTAANEPAPGLPPIPVAASDVEPPSSADNNNQNETLSPPTTTVNSNQDDSQIAASPSIDSAPLGPFYCHARCLATCLEGQLAKSVEQCQTICSPPEQYVPCDNNDTQCWRTCGFPGPVNEDLTPQSPSDFMPVSQVPASQLEPDPFVIELSWSAATNASLYILEFFPLNRQPREGENNYFQAVTSDLSYTVRKEDECMEYDARIMSVNYYGVSQPTYLHIPAPAPLMVSSSHFGLRAIQPDPRDNTLVTVTVDYSPPTGWPLNDVDIESVRVTATDCKGPLGTRTFDAFTIPPDTLNPAYNAIIGKEPTPAIQISFFSDVLQADCLFHMRVSSIKSVCNSTSEYQDNPALAPGIDFRINCGVLVGGCSGNGASGVATGQQQMPTPPPEGPIMISAPGAGAVISPPGILPPGIDRFIPGNSAGAVAAPAANIPTPPALPFGFAGQQQQRTQDSQQRPAPIDVVDQNGTVPAVQTIPTLPQAVNPPNCEMDIVDVQPSLSSLSPSLLAVQLTWLERQSMQPVLFQMPIYFTVRYGPIVRRLVEEYRSQSQIIPGYETILRTDPLLFSEQGPPRHLNISGLQRNGLFSVQVCAIYDQQTESYVQWRNVPSHRIDLAALESFLQVETQQSPSSPSAPPQQSPGVDFAGDDSTLLIELDVKSPADRAIYWLLVMAGVTVAILTVGLMLVCLRTVLSNNHNRSRRAAKRAEQPVIYVAPITTTAANPAAGDVVKVALP